MTRFLKILVIILLVLCFLILSLTIIGAFSNGVEQKDIFSFCILIYLKVTLILTYLQDKAFKKQHKELNGEDKERIIPFVGINYGIEIQRIKQENAQKLEEKGEKYKRPLVSKLLIIWVFVPMGIVYILMILDEIIGIF